MINQDDTVSELHAAEEFAYNSMQTFIKLISSSLYFGSSIIDRFVNSIFFGTGVMAIKKDRRSLRMVKLIKALALCAFVYYSISALCQLVSTVPVMYLYILIQFLRNFFI